jgi:hypothetical protein
MYSRMDELGILVCWYGTARWMRGRGMSTTAVCMHESMSEYLGGKGVAANGAGPVHERS